MLLEEFGDCFYMSLDNSHMIYRLKSSQVTPEGNIIKEGSWVLVVVGVIQDNDFYQNDLAERNYLTIGS